MRKELKPNQLMVLEAIEFYGLREIPEAEHNEIILGWFQKIGFDWIKDDETAWCSCFVNYLAQIHGIESSGKLDARSWLKVGKDTKKPEKGDIVVFWREKRKSWKGHIGLFMGIDGDQILCLGGNQSNQVNIKPYHKDRLLGYRKLSFTKKQAT